MCYKITFSLRSPNLSVGGLFRAQKNKKKFCCCGSLRSPDFLSCSETLTTHFVYFAPMYFLTLGIFECLAQKKPVHLTFLLLLFLKLIAELKNKMWVFFSRFNFVVKIMQKSFFFLLEQDIASILMTWKHKPDNESPTGVLKLFARKLKLLQNSFCGVITQNLTVFF